MQRIRVICWVRRRRRGGESLRYKERLQNALDIFAEITRLGVAVGANMLTFTGLTGFGDLIATCFSILSRNRYVGERLGRGDSLKDVLSSMPHVAEGVDTTHAVLLLAERYQVEMPITQVTAKLLFDGLTPKQAEAELLYRAPGPEWPPSWVD